MHDQRNICLIPIPFSDLSSSKKRPVLIISNSFYNSKYEDVLVMAITSNLANKEYCISINTEDIESGVLLHESIVRADKIYSIKQELIIKTFGKLKLNKFNKILEELSKLISIK
jgi:mRNA interferase MazF